MRLFKRSDQPGAVWWVQIGRKAKQSTFTTDRREAEEFGRALQERLWRAEKLGDRSALPFGEVATAWLSENAKEKRCDRDNLAWLSRGPQKIDDEPLSAVADPDVLDKLRQLAVQEGWARSTIDRLMTTVSSVLNFRQKEGRGYLPNRVSVPKYNEDLSEPRFLTPEQHAALNAELPPHQRLWAQFASLTLLRMRAMLSLRWSQVDFEQGIAWIEGRRQKNRKTFQFPLSPQALSVLREIQALQAAEYRAQVQRCEHRYQRLPPPPPDQVFTFQLRPVDNCNTAAFRRARERAGVPWCTWHILSRHTGASWAAQAGVTLEERMAIGGWKDARMAMRYSHLEPSQFTAAAGKVAQMWNRGRSVKSRQSSKKAVGS